MPQINDETLLLLGALQEFQQKLTTFFDTSTSHDYYVALGDLVPFVKNFDVTKYTEQILRNFLQQNFEKLIPKLGESKYIQEQNIKHNQSLVQMLLKKMLQVFSVNKKYHLAIKSLKCIFKFRQNVLFYPVNGEQKHSPFKNISAAARQKDWPITDFYRKCVQYLRSEFASYVKEIWNMKIEEVIELIDFFCYLEKNTQKTIFLSRLFQAYFSQYNALIKSARESLLNFANYERIIQLNNCFERSLQSVIKKQQLQKVIPVLSNSLLSQSRQHRTAALQLLNKFCKKIYDYNFYSEQQRLKIDLQSNGIFILLLNKDFSQQEYQQSQFLFKFFQLGNKINKVDYFLQLLKQKESKQKWFIKFSFKQLNVYSLQVEQKLKVVKYLQELPDLSSSYSEYSQCIEDLLYKQDHNENLQQRLFSLLNRLMKEAYLTLSENLQRKLVYNFRTATKGLRIILNKFDREAKVAYLIEYTKSLLSKLDTPSIFIFNLVFEESEVKNYFVNNDFQTIMNFVVQQLQIFDKIFGYLETQKNGQDHYKEIVKLIKFVSSKCSVKVDVTDKYIRTLAKFPEIYEQLIASQSYNKIKSQMEKILDLFKAQPHLPFHILKATFIKANYKKYSQVLKRPNLLSNKGEEHALKYRPKELEWYQQLISLLEQTPDKKLRQEIAQFLVLLHVNYCAFDANNNLDRVKQMDYLIEYFQQNTKSYRAKKASKNSVLANFELLIQMMQVTDILGVGAYRPHSSLVSTSTIHLTILNNATFGDDVQKSVIRNFPLNMVLFDLLTIVGQSFKCGPQDLVLRQGNRFIPIIYNGRVLEDLHFTGQEIIAQKNEHNFTKTPQVLKRDTKKEEISEIYLACLKEIFNRFAFEGKMGQIECMNYLRQVGDTYISHSDRKLKEIMDQYDKDNDGILNFEDFLAYNTKKLTGHYSSYYLQQFKKGLFNLRYRKNMTLYTQPLDISNEYHLMMRFRLSCEANIYEELFVYSQDQYTQISQKAQEILLYLPTYPLYSEQTFEISNLYKNSDFFIFYKLILIESQLNQQNPKLSPQDNRAFKREKITQFIKNQSNQVIFQLMVKYYQQLNYSPFSYKCFTLCLKILRSLIDIDNLIQTKIEDLKFSYDSIHSLPDTKFFSVEILKALQAENSINFEVLLVLQLTQSSIDLQPIIQSCFNSDEEIRKACCNFIYLWQQKNNWEDNLFDVKITQTNMIEWFDLLSTIIQRTDRFDLENVLTNTINILEQREETLYDRYDKLMFGYLKLLKVILAKRNQLISLKRLHLLIQKLLPKTISSKNRTLLYQILTFLNPYIMFDYFEHMLTTTLPSQECEIRTVYVGLQNLGATCYINSIIQQFFMIEKFKNLILNRSVPTNLMQIEVNQRMVIDNFMYQLQKMYQNLNSSQKKYFVPKDFCYSFKGFDGKPIDTGIQEDSHEFLNRLIENVEEACKQDGNLERLQSICQIKTLSELECGECKNRIDKIQNNYSCMLQVQEQDSLQKSLKKYNQKQEIQGYTCENCQKKVNTISKRTYLHELPEVVILNLQRIIYDQRKGDKIKVHTALTFPMEINFEEYMKHSNLENMNTKYRLKGVVIHTGTSAGGHYYSLIRDSRSQKWYKFNDQSVIQFDQKEIARQGFGGFQSKDNQFQEVTYSTNAYILFYESSDAKKIEYLQAQNKLSYEVQEQNTRLIQEIQIHQESFFIAISNLYEKYRFKNIEKMMEEENFFTKSSKQKNLFKKILQVHLKAFSFLSVFSSVQNEVKVKISHNIQEMYFLLPEQINKFFAQLNVRTFLENIISHRDATFRENLKHIFIRNVIIFIKKQGININEEKETSIPLKNIIDSLISLLTDNILYQNINKSSFFFILLLDLINCDQNMKIYLMKRQIMFKMLDLLMGRESFYMKYHLKAQDVPNKIAFTVLQIISKVLSNKTNLKNAFNNNQNIDFYMETTKLQAKILMSSTFCKRIFRLNYNHQLVIPLIEHYSRDDFDYTLVICDVLLQQINKPDQFDLEILFAQLETLLRIQDKYQHLRWCFLIGLPQYIQVRPHIFCLNFSDRSENTCYISGLYPNKEDKFKFQAERRPLLQIIFGEKAFRIQNLVLLSLGLVTTLAETNQRFFQYLLRIPPPNYLKLSIFELIPEITSKLLQDQDFIIEKKSERIDKIINLYQLIEQRLKISEKKLPIKNFIIGKNKESYEVDKLELQKSSFTLRRFDTYVLQNLPLGHQNRSMPKSFNEGKGLASLFFDVRSTIFGLNQDKIEGKQFQPTVYVLRGKVQQKVILSFTNWHFDYTVMLSQGDFNLNMPYLKQGQILDFVKIGFYNEVPHQTNNQQLKAAFYVEEEEKKQEQDSMLQEKNLAAEKIQCRNCTLWNQLTSQRCEVCQNPLFM